MKNTQTQKCEPCKLLYCPSVNQDNKKSSDQQQILSFFVLKVLPSRNCS